MTLSWIERRRLRIANLLGFLGCAALIAGAYYMEFVVGLEPCPLCMLQRVALAGLGLVFLLAFLHGPRAWGRHVYGVLVLLTAGVGTAVAGRHVWLQSLPPEEVPACGPGLDYMLDTFPLTQTLRMVLEGSGECAEVHLAFGLSIPIWTLGAFIVIGLFGIWANMKPRERAIWL